MRFYIIILSVIAMQVICHAQFDKVIFRKETTMWNNEMQVIPHVLALGDQNHDGFDDILVINSGQKKAMIFYGGNHMDTIPKISFIIDTAYRQLVALVAIDLNDDGYKDIVISYIKEDNTITVKIYYGGSILDTIPKFIMSRPNGASNNWGNIYSMKDFNGDGRSELIITDGTIPFSQKQYGAWYIYNTGTKFDPTEFKVITGDSTKEIELYTFGASFGDLNGDGLTDMSLEYYQYPIGTGQSIRTFIPGNKNWDFTPVTVFEQKEHKFDVVHMEIIEDINGDKKDDILMLAYGPKYPYWCHNSILYGSLPVDTVQDIGLNTENEGINTIYSISPGDVNGDGYNDLWGMRQSWDSGAKLYLGGKNKTRVEQESVKNYYGGEDGFGRMLAKVGDVNGDGLADLCIASVRYDSWEKNPYSVVYIISGDTLFKDTTTTAVTGEIKKITPEDYKLFQPYPNPFNPSVTISYYLNTRSSIIIKIFDLLGREITTLIDEEKDPGRHNVVFDTTKYKLSSGIYFVEMQVNKAGNLFFSDRKKIQLVK